MKIDTKSKRPERARLTIDTYSYSDTAAGKKFDRPERGESIRENWLGFSRACHVNTYCRIQKVLLTIGIAVWSPHL